MSAHGGNPQGEASQGAARVEAIRQRLQRCLMLHPLHQPSFYAEDVAFLLDEVQRIRGRRLDGSGASNALTWYPFGGLDGLLGEVEQALRAHGADCQNPESCGPLGCLLAKLYHARQAIRAATPVPLGNPCQPGSERREAVGTTDVSSERSDAIAAPSDAPETGGADDGEAK